MGILGGLSPVGTTVAATRRPQDNAKKAANTTEKNQNTRDLEHLSVDCAHLDRRRVLPF